MFCRNCGNQLSDNVAFCNKCGNKITNVSTRCLSRKEWYLSERSSISKGKITAVWVLYIVSCALALLLFVLSFFSFFNNGSETYNLLETFAVLKASPIYNQVIILLIVLLIGEMIAKFIGFFVCYKKRVFLAVIFVVYSFFGFTITKVFDIFLSIAILVLTILIDKDYKKHSRW